jgi:hypothetical protein
MENLLKSIKKHLNLLRTVSWLFYIIILGAKKCNKKLNKYKLKINIDGREITVYLKKNRSPWPHIIIINLLNLRDIINIKNYEK